MQCLVFIEGTVLAKDWIWFVQLNGHVSRACQKPTQTILPNALLCGVVWSTPVGSRSVDAGFFGVGLSHLGVEALIAMSNKLLIHYGYDTATGRFMWISFNLFYLELGLSFQPMQESFAKYSHQVTHSWVKMLWEKISLFEIQAVFADCPLQLPQEGNQFLMQVLIQAGYTGETLLRLNRVRISLQVLFLSDVLTASGRKVCIDILSRRPKGKAWSTMRWPREQPTASDMLLWHNAMKEICPSSRGGTPKVGDFTGDTHRVWCWFWNKTDSLMHHIDLDGATEEVYMAGRKPNRFLYSHTQQQGEHDAKCSVQSTIDGQQWRLLSTAKIAPQIPTLHSFVEVLQSWGNTWLWDHMTVHGGAKWLDHAIVKGTLVAVTDGSYIRDLYPNLCSAAFVLECSAGRGRLYGSFLETLLAANAYRGESLGLMAIHLILLSVNKLHPELTGSVEIVSDCLGALKRVSYLPPYWIPLRCRHSNILKTILVSCRGLTSQRTTRTSRHTKTIRTCLPS
jgi:hypothetical protein